MGNQGYGVIILYTGEERIEWGMKESSEVSWRDADVFCVLEDR